MTEESQKKKFTAEIGRMLKIVIDHVYTNKEISIRELISNASDACDKFKYHALQQGGFDEELKVTIEIDKEKKSISIQDNGIGMDDQDMIDNLGTIANSGTQRFLEHVSSSNNPDLQLIGQFGIGFYSAFMIADLVTVYSKKVDQDKIFMWESDGKGEYSVKEVEGDYSRGTLIKLHLKSVELDFLERHKIQHIVKTYSDHISFPIELKEGESSEVVNTASALWTKNPSDVSAEQYKEFYSHVAHSPDDPWMTLHNKIEGNITYTNLLFIPENKPFDLFHPQAKSRVKLYIKRVFITDEGTNLLPSYLRFFRGIIDSEDLPLNISRETLQSNAMVTKIRKSLVKKILLSLKKKADSEVEEFTKFWNNFGEVMKEGLCEGALQEKEELLEVCHFRSTKSGDGLISLKQYVENMKDEQEEIYYITGNNIDALRSSPQIEGFIKKGIEILLLSDHVDDFWVNVVYQYKNKPLKSISSAEVNLNKISQSSEEKKEEDNELQNDLTNFVKEVLGSRVKEVRISTKLVDSASCLVIPEGHMNVRMEKLLIEQKQLKERSSKILEINPDHFLIKKIEKHMNEEDKSEISDLIEIIFAQACLIEGEIIDNPNSVVQKINNLLKNC